jgi:predicted flap endonuclease-1-like 5' DNA nuclease
MVGIAETAEIKRLQEEVESLRTRLSTQRQEARTNHKNAERLRNEIAILKAKAPSEAAKEALEKERTRHQEIITALELKHETELRALEDSLSQKEAEPPPSNTDRVAELEEKIADLQEQNSRLEQQLDELRLSGELARGDDLTRIRGVGPAFAKALVEHGFTSFSQIASWTPEQIAELAPKLKSTVPRVKKWVASARELAG